VQQILNIVERKGMHMAQKKAKFTVPEIVEFLRKEEDNETIEGQLLRTKLIRELYKQLGDPTEEDFGAEMEPAGTWWNKHKGYTTDIQICGENYMKNANKASTDWRIKRASGTKIAIVERYTRNGWHCKVDSYNVICTKYVPHPKYKDIFVEFYSSRDCNKYEYVIKEKGNE